MRNTIIIKGNKYGITIVLDNDVPFSQLVKDLSAKLENAEEFFDSEKQLAVSFEGRALSNEEMDELLYVIASNSKLNIQYVMDQNNDLETTFFDIIQTAKELENNEQTSISSDALDLHRNPSDVYETDFDVEYTPHNYELSTSTSALTNDTGLFYKGTLRSGQCLEAKDSIIIIGDVNPGATVLAGGNIVVIGSLKGSVSAGINGNRNAFVMALSMSPVLIQIADVIAESADAKKIPKSKKDDAMIAIIVDEQICIDRVSKTAIHNINSI